MLMTQVLDESERITVEDVEDVDTEELLKGLQELGDKHLHIPQLLEPRDLYSPMMESKDKEHHIAVGYSCIIIFLKIQIIPP